jgi:hypothetical protein
MCKNPDEYGSFKQVRQKILMRIHIVCFLIKEPRPVDLGLQI